MSGKRVVENIHRVYDLTILLCEEPRVVSRQMIERSSCVKVMRHSPSYEGGRGRGGYGGIAR